MNRAPALKNQTVKAASIKTAVIWAGVAMGLLVFTQFMLPGGGAGQRGTPAAILFRGVVYGLVSSLTAAGIILVYRTQRVVNFAQTAVGAAGGALTFQFQLYTGVPFLVAFLAGLLTAGLVGVIVDLALIRRFFNAPRLVLTVVTIVVAGFLSETAADIVRRLPFFPSENTLAVTDLPGARSIREQLPFPGFHFQVGGLPDRFGFPEVFAIEVAIVCLLGLAAFFRFTKSGVAVRAMAENTERASLLGISVGRLSTIVWGIAGLLGGAGVILTGFLQTPGVASGFAPSVLLPAMAAAVVARMRNLPTAVAAAIAISVLTQSATYSLQRDLPLIDLGLFLVVAVGLLMQQRKTLRGGDEVASAWQASEEQRPVPRELLAVPSVRIGRRVLIGAALGFVVLYPFLVSTRQTNLGGVIAINAIVAISLVVLTGWAGQVSLGQYAFVAIGGVIGGALTSKVGLTFWLAAPLATFLTGAFAVVVGIPALRIRGLFLAVTTFGFAVATQKMLFSERYFGWLVPEQVDRPSLFFFDFEDERSMYFLCVAGLLLTIVLVTNARRSRFGRVLIALRESEANVASFGITVVKTRLAAFAFAGALCGFAGVLFAHQQRSLNPDSFTAQASVDIFVLAVLGGIGSVSGALLGSLYINISDYFVKSALYQGIIGSGGTLLLLYAAPGGLISVFCQMRDAVLRVVAQRRQMVVPSLFADYDPDALEKQLIPMAPPASGSGLDALPADMRFTLESNLYQGRGVRIFNKRDTLTKAQRETAAIGAAASKAEEVDE